MVDVGGVCGWRSPAGQRSAHVVKALPVSSTLQADDPG